MRKIVILVACLALLVLFISCSKSAPKAEANLILLTEEYPPLTYAVGDSLTGYGTEVVAALQKVLQTNYKTTVMNWDAAYQRALNEPNIVIFTMEQIPERQDLFHWIGPLGANKTNFYVRKKSNLKIDSLAAAKDIEAIGTVTNWFSEQYLKQQGFTNLVSTAEPESVVINLMKRQVDVAVLTDLSYMMIALNAGYLPTEMKPVFELMSTNYYIGISKKTDKAIVEKWQQAFSQIVQDGTLAKIKNKWLPGT